MNSSIIKNGQISLIIGSMFSGKSSELLRQLNVFSRCYKCIFITHSKDTRNFLSHNPIIKSDLKDTNITYMKCDDLNSIDISGFEVIGIDEAQFFNVLKKPVIKFAKQQKIVIVAGLDSDYNQNVFEEVISLIPYSTDIKKLSSLCHFCLDEKSPIINFAPMTVMKKNSEQKYNDRLIIDNGNIFSVSCINHMK